MHWNAQGALRDLIRVYNSFKRHHPHRFGSNSNYEEMLEECKLYELGIDMVMLEMKLRGEFRCTPLLRKAKRNWEEAEFDHADIIEEAAVEPVREEADAMPRVGVGADVIEEAAVEPVREEADAIPRVEVDADVIEEAAVEPVREEADAMPRFEELVEEEPVVELVEEEIVFDQADVDEEGGEDEEEVEPPPKKSRTRRRNDVSCLKSQLGRYWDAPRSTRSRKKPKRYGCSD